MNNEYKNKTKDLIDGLKNICSKEGLGNDANEYKIITQSFLYKFLNDKFLHDIKVIEPTLSNIDNITETLKNYDKSKYELMLSRLDAGSARLKPEHLISHLFSNSTQPDFAKLLDNTLNDIAILNNEIFSVQTIGGARIRLFDQELIRNAIQDEANRDNFARSIINKLAESKFNFEEIMDEGFDFFSTMFEYMIKDYNKDGGGKYAEYYTPHSVSKIMASILVDSSVSNVTVYDPAAGSGTLLMNMAHAIGEDKCSIYSQDISQKSSNLLRLNLILNNLAHSINHVIQGNTITKPENINKRFDYIVSNPPFKLDFSDEHSQILSLSNVGDRFFAGVPSIPNKKKESMAIYLLFIQHIMYMLSDTGHAAVVVPTGFITAQSGIEKKIREKLINKKWLKGVVSMPSNIFATTGTNVSIIFIDKTNTDKVVLVDASKLGTKVKEGKNQKTLLSFEEEQKIINVFKNKETIDDFSVVVDYQEIKDKNYSFSAGQYFDIKIEYTDITPEEFKEKMEGYQKNLSEYFKESGELEEQIFSQLKNLKYE